MAGGGAAWRGLVAMVERRRAALVTAAGGLGAAWKSAAGIAAAGHVTRLGDPLLAARAAFLEVDQVLAVHAAALVRARAALAAAASRDRDRPRTAGWHRPTRLCTARVDAATAGLADAADRAAAARLAQLSAAAAARVARGRPARAPGAGRLAGDREALVGRVDAGRAPWLVTHEPG